MSEYSQADLNKVKNHILCKYPHDCDPEFTLSNWESDYIKGIKVEIEIDNSESFLIPDWVKENALVSINKKLIIGTIKKEVYQIATGNYNP